MTDQQLTGLDIARQRRREMAEAGIAVERLDPIERARANPKSLRAAITGKCWDCVGAGCDPNPRKAVRECASEKTCSLWPVRPYQKKSEETGETEESMDGEEVAS